jgi:hypothetical protein
MFRPLGHLQVDSKNCQRNRHEDGLRAETCNNFIIRTYKYSCVKTVLHASFIPVSDHTQRGCHSPRSGSFLDSSELLEIQIESVVYHPRSSLMIADHCRNK